jgi:hypothetical protein
MPGTTSKGLENLVSLLEEKNVKILVKCYSKSDAHYLTSSCNPKEIVEVGAWFSVTGFTNTLLEEGNE